MTEPEVDFLNFNEAARLVEASDPHWYVMLLTGLRAGLRLGELIGFRWEDVNLAAGRLVVRQAIVRGGVCTPKNGKKRKVQLSPELRDALKQHLHARGRYVFCDRDGSPLAKGATK